MSSLTRLPGLDQMKVEAKSPEEAVQLVRSVPLSPCQGGPSGWQPTWQSWCLPRGGEALPPPLPGKAPKASRAELSWAEQLGAATCGNTKAALPAPGRVRKPWWWLGLWKCIPWGRTSLLASWVSEAQAGAATTALAPGQPAPHIKAGGPGRLASSQRRTERQGSVLP